MRALISVCFLLLSANIPVSSLSLVIPPIVPSAAADYQIITGTCPHEVLSHLKEEDSTTSDCSAICSANQECCGFGFDRVSGECTPKKDCCQVTSRKSLTDTGADTSFHYVKLSYATSTWAPSYEAKSGNCPHADLLELGGLMNVTRCAELCDWYKDKCAGFVIFDGHVCRLKTAVCRQPVTTNPLDTLYMKKIGE